MKKFFPILAILFLLIISCAGTPETKPEPIPEIIPESIPEIVQEKPEIPSLIMGNGILSADNLSRFLLYNNPQINTSYAFMLSHYYIEEAAFEGVNHDVAFAQMCLETGFLKFGGLVTPDQYNFAGLGATGLPGPDGSPERGLYFPDPRTGVRAQIQHLKAYASTEPLNGELVNPRFRFVRRGSSPTVEGLAGTWAADKQYAVKINSILERFYEFSFKTYEHIAGF